MTGKNSKDEQDSRNFMAENLESRLLFSAAPADIPLPAVHEASPHIDLVEGEESYAFEPLNALHLGALMEKESGVRIMDAGKLHHDFVSTSYEVEIELGKNSGVYFSGSPEGTRTLVMVQEPSRVFGMEEALHHHASIRVMASMIL